MSDDSRTGNAGNPEGGSPLDVIEHDRRIKEREADPVPGTAENERAATRGNEAPDPIDKGGARPGVPGKA